MTSVGLRELRQNASDLVRRVEAGEEITITVAGRPSVRLVAARAGQWRRWEEVSHIFDGREDVTWQEDRRLLDDDVADPWDGA